MPWHHRVVRLAAVVGGLAAWLITPAPASGQSAGTERPDIEALLSTPESSATIEELRNGFLTHFLILVPDLLPEDRDLLFAAVEEAFAPDSIRAATARALASTTSTDDTAGLIESYDSGALAELRDIEDGYAPETSLQEFGSNIGALDPTRLQLMVSVVEARRAGELAISIDQALQQLAHQLVVALGGDPGPSPQLTDEQFETSYRNQTVRLGVEAMHRLHPASADIVKAAVDIYAEEGARKFSERYIEAMLVAVGRAGQSLGELIAADVPATEPDDAPSENPEDAPPCFVLPCGFTVEWRGSEPSGGTILYRAPGELEDNIYRVLVGAGYRLVRGPDEEGFTIRLRPSAQRARCEVMSGTDNRTCQAVGEVRIELLGTYPGYDGVTSFLVRNRCLANEIMAARDFASLVAARLHYELTTFEGDERRTPGC